MMSSVILAGILLPPAVLVSSLGLLAWAGLLRAFQGWPRLSALTPLVMLALPLLAAGTVLALSVVPLVHDAPGASPHAVIGLADLGPAATPLALFSGLLGVVSLVRGTALMRRALRQRRRLAGWMASSRRARLDGNVVILAPLGAPNAFSVGWRHGLIVVDDSWWRALPPADRRIVVAHEAAHAGRRDALVVALLAVVSILSPRAVAGPVVRAWRSWAELAADLAAARRHGDPADVASLLVREHRRLSRAANPLGAPAFGDASFLETRVRALLDGRIPSSALRPDLGAPALLSLGVIAAAPLLCADLLHVACEFLLGLGH